MASPVARDAAVVDEVAPQSSHLPKDILILAVVVAHLWVITMIWRAVDLSGKLNGVKVGEADVWLLALSGLLLPIIAILPVILIWSKILAGFTSLLVFNFVLRGRVFLVRWPISLALAACLVLLIGVGATESSGGAAAVRVPAEEGLPTQQEIAMRERMLAARCVKPSDPNIVAYCQQREQALRMLNDLE